MIKNDFFEKCIRTTRTSARERDIPDVEKNCLEERKEKKRMKNAREMNVIRLIKSKNIKLLIKLSSSMAN